MKKIPYLFFVLSFFILPNILMASQQVVPGLEITTKKLPMGKVTVVSSNPDGTFVFNDLEVGDYQLYLNGESTELGKVSTVNGKISGRVLIDFDDANQATPFFNEKDWTKNFDAIHITKLADMLKKKGIISADTDLNSISLKTLPIYIKKFQLKYGITQTGKIGPMTAKKLNSLLNSN